MRLEDELEHLNQMIIKMSEQVIFNLNTAMEIYKNYDEEKASLINDDVVDLHERLIEEMCLNIMLKERPFAKDLRLVSGILKLVSDLERLGDHAEDIRDIVKKRNDHEYFEFIILNQCFENAMSMVKDSIISFINKDIDLANEVINRDAVVDELFERGIKKIIERLDNKEYSNKYSIYATLVIKYVERIADHAVNIAEWVIYILVGYHKDTQII